MMRPIYLYIDQLCIKPKTFRLKIPGLRLNTPASILNMLVCMSTLVSTVPHATCMLLGFHPD